MVPAPRPSIEPAEVVPAEAVEDILSVVSVELASLERDLAEAERRAEDSERELAQLGRVTTHGDPSERLRSSINELLESVRSESRQALDDARVRAAERMAQAEAEASDILAAARTEVVTGLLGRPPIAPPTAQPAPYAAQSTRAEVHPVDADAQVPRGTGARSAPDSSPPWMVAPSPMAPDHSDLTPAAVAETPPERPVAQAESVTAAPGPRVIEALADLGGRGAVAGQVPSAGLSEDPVTTPCPVVRAAAPRSDRIYGPPVSGTPVGDLEPNRGPSGAAAESMGLSRNHMVDEEVELAEPTFGFRPPLSPTGKRRWTGRAAGAQGGPSPGGFWNEAQAAQSARANQLAGLGTALLPMLALVIVVVVVLAWIG